MHARLAILPCLFIATLYLALGRAASGGEQPWRDLFDGRTLSGWKVTNFGGEGEVTVVDGVIELDFGAPLTGITYTGDVPKQDYELRLEARRVDGIDFFGTTTFPVGESFCSFVLGGWSGSIVGISNIDDQDASSNKTTRFLKLAEKQWYKVRIRVTGDRIRTWIDDKLIVDQPTIGRKLSTRAEVDLSQPLGICAFETRAQLRRIQLRTLAEK